MERLCYTTGTFDVVHKGHIEFLKACKKMIGPNVRLCIGLTTDELAYRQKRKPILTYEHRRDILIEFPYVDVVIPHNGEPKCEAWERLHFTDLAIELEYRGASEYKEMEKLVKVHYIPGPLRSVISSTALTAAFDIEFAKRLDILANGGPSGIIFKYEAYCEPIVIKPIRISYKEFGNTRNVYNLPVPPPRNWKKCGAVHKYLNLPGVNGNRELECEKILCEYKWFPYIKVKKSYSLEGETRSTEAYQDYSHINCDKTNYARAIYLLVQKHGGETLAKFVQMNQSMKWFTPDLNRIVNKVRNICVELTKEGVVHGDLHDGNVCVRPIYNSKTIGMERAIVDYEVTLIDFGWCLSRNFELEEDEKNYLEQCLKTNWDFNHFLDSIRYTYGTREWYMELIV